MGWVKAQLWVWIVPALSLALFTQYCSPCRGKKIEEEWVTEGGTLSSKDNKIHYKIGIQVDIPETVRDAVTKAVSSAVEHWNVHSDLSKIVLELDKSARVSGDADLWIIRSNNSAQSGRCAKFKPDLKPDKGGAVVYNIEGYESWIAKDAEAASMVMAHEIGHFLGLKNGAAETDTIMAPGYDRGPGSCEYYATTAVAKRPTAADARDAGECVWTHHKKFSSMVPVAKSASMAAGLIFSLLSFAPAAAQNASSNGTPSPDQDVAREQAVPGLMSIPEAARRVRGDYVVELAPDEFVVRSLEALAIHSDAIVIARLIEAKAYLSKDKLSIATAYLTEVAEYLKDPRTITPKTRRINIILPGGKVQLSDGRSAEMRIRDQKPLIAGEQYVFFLQRANEADQALPAEADMEARYVPRLGAQGVFQLTEAGLVKLGAEEVSPALRKYNDTSRTDFVKKIKDALHQDMRAKK